MSRILASIGLFVEASRKPQVLAALSKLENLEELYDVSGEYDVLSIFSASSMSEVRDILHEEVLKISGVKTAVTNIILKPYKPPQRLKQGVTVSVKKSF